MPPRRETVLIHDTFPSGLARRLAQTPARQAGQVRPAGCSLENLGPSIGMKSVDRRPGGVTGLCFDDSFQKLFFPPKTSPDGKQFKFGFSLLLCSSNKDALRNRGPVTQ
jgi:hypothetical protein